MRKVAITVPAGAHARYFGKPSVGTELSMNLDLIGFDVSLIIEVIPISELLVYRCKLSICEKDNELNINLHQHMVA